MEWSTKSKFKLSAKYGTSLIEVLISVSVVLFIVVSLLSLFTTGIRLVYQNKARIAAVALANQQLEQIRNLPYDDIGTQNGVPGGSLPQTQIITQNGINFTVDTNIEYVDDVYDNGTSGNADTVPTDYKTATVNISWNVTNKATSITLTTNITPSGPETNANGGTLRIEVYDPSIDPISPVNQALVTITAPSINITKKTNSDGLYTLYGAPPGTEAYHVSVTKSGYSTAQTYTTDPLNNPTPQPADLNIVSGDLTTQYLEISPLVTSLTIQTLDLTTSTPISTMLTMHSKKTIGNDSDVNPIYKFNQTITTDAAGNYTLTNFEADTYYIDLDDSVTDYIISGYSPLLPLTVLPQTTNTLTLSLSPAVPTTALFTITNADNQILPNATVRLYRTEPGFDNTITTNSAGQAFFSDLPSVGAYALEINLTGYISYNNPVTITQYYYEPIILATQS
ncbi:MAG: carboxypeptidase regulatory-like domain-containing protein [Patescibacteria group bacterium]|jgi:hypothetical protein